MDGRLLLWTLVVFFGASIAFRAVQSWTESSPVVVTILLEIVVMGAIVALVVALVRRGRSPQDPDG